MELKSLNRKIAGRKAKRAGSLFENILDIMSKREGLGLLRIPNGSRVISSNKWQKPQLIPEKSPFDFVLLKEKTLPVFFDAKTTEGATFSYSQIKRHQLHSLEYMRSFGYKSGYLVLFRKTGDLSFFSSEQLKNLQKKTSLKPVDGVSCGSIGSPNLTILFT